MSGFIKLMRSGRTDELLGYPHEFLLLSVIAIRAKRSPGATSGLDLGEALIGDFRNYGMSERTYRTAKANLEKWGFAAFTATNKGTLAKLINSDVYDINLDEGDRQPTGKTTGKRRTNRQADRQADDSNKTEEKQDIASNFQETPTGRPTGNLSEKRQANRRVTRIYKEERNRALPSGFDPQLWEDFKDHRKKIRKPMTALAENMLLEKLVRFAESGQDPNAIVRQSIENGWTGLFPLKANTQPKPTPHPGIYKNLKMPEGL